jgi:hypothetical protein
MSVCVFIGPTLAAQEARAVCPDAVLLPPVRQGDVYRVTTSLRPDAIGIVDGYFSYVPSVWHKEILYAMSAGTPVYGAASMGALRAAELAQFGMVGVGRVFEAYRDGVLEPFAEPFEDDDEVAVLHGPPELGYRALSEALINVRCTLVRATEQGVIDAATRDRLVRVGKALFYQERSYKAILSLAGGSERAADVERLRAWLPDGKVDQKRTDAILLLQALPGAKPADAGARYTLAETTLWERAKAGIDLERAPPAPELEELRLQGAAYLAARALALDRLLDPDCVQSGGPERQDPLDAARPPDPVAPVVATRERELLGAQLPGVLLERHILAELRASGADRALRRRADEKRQRLALVQLARPVPTGDLVAWYFARQGTIVPADLETYARNLDFPTLDAFHRCLLDEYLFRAAADAARPNSPPIRSEVANVDRTGFEARGHR